MEPKNSNKPHNPILRVFVGSPGDVSAERDAVSEVIERLNNELDGEGSTIRLQAIRWENYPHPRDTRWTPQEAIAKHLPRPAVCDAAVFIFWNRIGTVLDMKDLEPNGAGEKPTGSTWEFYDALESGKPRVLTYQKTATAAKLPSETGVQARERMAQELAVIDFFESLQGPNKEFTHYTQQYGQLSEFAADLKEQLRLFVREHQRGPSTSLVTPPALDSIPVSYLRYLCERYQHIDLGAFSSDEPLATRLPLIYVPAVTSARAVAEKGKGREEKELGRLHRSERETVLERLGEQSLYLPGNAGQGKTTFCQWLMLTLGHTKVPAMPLDEDCEPEYRERLPQSLAGRLPLLLRLSEFWRSLELQPGQTGLSCHQLEQGLSRWLNRQRPGDLESERFLHHLGKGNVLLVLDGADEVPEVSGALLPRQALLNGLIDALPGWIKRDVRVLLTSRPYGLSRAQVQALALEEAPLALLPWPLQALFVKRWFKAVGSQADVNELLDELQTREDLRELRENPLLLTAVCVKYHNQKRLPQDIHDLYQSIVEQVLYSRFRGGRNERDAIARQLEVIALGMHAGSKAEPRRAPVRDIPLSDIDRYLANYAAQSPTQEGGAEHAAARREELLSDSGLLLNWADQRAGFFHWTVQDYFTAQRLHREQKPFSELLTQYATHIEWHRALHMLLARLMAERDADQVLRELDALRPLITPAALKTQTGPARLLGKLLEIVHFRTGGRMGDWTHTLKQVCLDSLQRVEDPAVRNTLFTDLARVGGDDRLGVGLNSQGLPDIDWVNIPAGPFRYGEDKEKIELDQYKRTGHSILARPARWGFIRKAGRRMELRIWQVMYGNGRAVTMMQIKTVTLCAAVGGALILTVCVPPFATGATLTSATTVSVFGLCASPIGKWRITMRFLCHRILRLAHV